MSDSYVIEGVGCLPADRAPFRAVSATRFIPGVFQNDTGFIDRFPGRSLGYSGLPTGIWIRFAQDIPHWSAYVRQEAERFGCAYMDMSDDFPARLLDAEAFLVDNRLPAKS